MAGLSGKAAWLGLAKQTGGTKLMGTAGTAPTVPVYKLPFSGGSIGPSRDNDRLAETDVSRDQGAAFTTMGGVDGSPEVYVRDDTIGAILLAVLGQDTVTGTTNFIHTFTPANTLPFYTIWKNVGGAAGLYESYTDCIIGSATISAEAGAPLTCAMGVQGITPTKIPVGAGTTALDAIALNQGVVYNFNNVTNGISLNGTASRSVRSFELTIENNITRQQTDDFLPWDIVAGTREISLGFDMLFEDVAEYSKFHYGSAAGTQIQENIYTTTSPTTFTFTLGTNNSISFTFPSLAYEEFPVDPDPGGDPIIVPVRAVAQRATGVSNLVSAVVKNQVATY